MPLECVRVEYRILFLSCSFVKFSAALREDAINKLCEKADVESFVDEIRIDGFVVCGGTDQRPIVDPKNRGLASPSIVVVAVKMLSQQQLNFFEEQGEEYGSDSTPFVLLSGYLVIEDFVNADEVASLYKRAQELLQNYDPAEASPFSATTPVPVRTPCLFADHSCRRARLRQTIS